MLVFVNIMDINYCICRVCFGRVRNGGDLLSAICDLAVSHRVAVTALWVERSDAIWESAWIRRRERSKPGVVLVKVVNCLRRGCFCCFWAWTCLGCGARLTWGILIDGFSRCILGYGRGIGLISMEYSVYQL